MKVHIAVHGAGMNQQNSAVASSAKIEPIGYRGHLDIGGPLIRGWCASRDGEPGRVSVFVDGKFKAEFIATNYRKDLDERGFCKTGGGFELDISGFLTPFAVSKVQIKNPLGGVLTNGEFEVDYLSIVRGEFDHLFHSEDTSIGLFGSSRLAAETAHGTVFSKILYALGAKPNRDEPGDRNIWHCHPHRPKPDVPYLINRDFVDISKSGIDKAHVEVFGRALCVNPGDIDLDTSYVIKSEANATHDGRIVAGADIPGMNLEGLVIQRVIDNATPCGNSVRDIRVPVIGGSIPFVYIKRRPIGTRFSNANRQASITAAGNVLDTAEQEQILRFCRLIGFDYGELDVLRDNRDHQIWIVDANNTPAGPPNGLTRMEVAMAVREMALAFQREFLNPGSFFEAPESAALKTARDAALTGEVVRRTGLA